MHKILSQYPLFVLTIPGTYLVHVANYCYRLLDWKPVAGEILLYLVLPVIYDRLYDSISSVNTFRVVLDQFFHQQLPLLKDSLVYLKKRIK